MEPCLACNADRRFEQHSIVPWTKQLAHPRHS
jgi:hypothetical protein